MMHQDARAWIGEWNGEEAVWLAAGGYEAVLLPSAGGNLVRFREVERDLRFLHEPTEKEWERFREKPTHYGVPVLFPPNRLEDGKFPWNGVTYAFPINNAAHNNHSHGFLLRETWETHDYGTVMDTAHAAVEARVGPGHPAYAYFPHTFTFRMTYTLGANGLTQLVEVHNLGQEELPVLLGFHTSINAPFAPGSRAEDYRFTLNVGRRIEMGERMLPTGRLLELTPWEEEMRSAGADPFAMPLDHHYTAESTEGPNRMELTDNSAKIKLVYETHRSYKHWMLFNNGATPGYFCPEPQTCRVNAPNLGLSREDSGMIGVLPGDTWSAASRLYPVEL
ncbi:aldose 1-epimerase [Gorillibacterium sp. sgz5001074]|uniref:aldose 1-epimerase n=1 Tax=Gorillibacterium sp. sgz5001074 TaxID=3446695 RepID=UPI003F661065